MEPRTRNIIIGVVAVLLILCFLCSIISSLLSMTSNATPSATNPPNNSPTPPNIPPSEPVDPLDINNKSCAGGYATIRGGGDLNDFNLASYTGITSIADCLEKCEADPKCDWVSYNGSNCITKSWSKKPEQGAYTYLALSNGCDYVAPNASSSGDKMNITPNPVKNVNSQKDCGNLCQSTPGCDLSNYETVDKDCELFSGPHNDFVAYVSLNKVATN